MPRQSIRVQKRTRVRNIGRSHDSPNLFHRVQVWRQSTVHREDLLVNDCSYGQAIEAVRESLPKFDIVPSLAYRETVSGRFRFS